MKGDGIISQTFDLENNEFAEISKIHDENPIENDYSNVYVTDDNENDNVNMIQIYESQ